MTQTAYRVRYAVNAALKSIGISPVLALLFSPGYPFFPTTDHLVAALEVLLDGFCKLEAEENQRALIPFIDQFVQYLSAHITTNTKRRKVFSLFITRCLLLVLRVREWVVTHQEKDSLRHLSILTSLALFPPGSPAEFAAAFSGVSTKENPGIRHYFLELFQVLSDAVKSEDETARRAALFYCGPLLAEFAAATEVDWSAPQREGQSETRRSAQFGFFARLVFAMRIHQKVSATDVMSLRALRILLEELAKLDLSPPAGAASLTTQLAQDLTAAIADASDATASGEAAGAFASLALTDAPSVESYLPSLLPNLWQSPYSATAASLVKLYGRLRQLDTFLRQVFAALLKGPTPSHEALAPLVASLSECITQAPSGQLPALWSLFSSQLESFTFGDVLSARDPAVRPFAALFCAFLDALLPSEATHASFINLAISTLTQLAPALGPLIGRYPKEAKKSHRTLAPLLSLYLSLLRVYQASLQLQPKSSFSDDLFTFAFAATSVDIWAMPTPEPGMIPFLTGVLTELRMRRLEELHIRRMRRTQLQHGKAVAEDDGATGKRKKKAAEVEEDTEGKRPGSAKKRSKEEHHSGASKPNNGNERNEEDSDESMQQYADQLVGSGIQLCTCNVEWRGQWDSVTDATEEVCGVWRLRTSFFHLLACYASDKVLWTFLSALLNPCSCFFSPRFRQSIGGLSHRLLSSAAFYELHRVRELVPQILLSRFPEALAEFHLPSSILSLLEQAALEVGSPLLSSWPETLSNSASGDRAAQVLQLLAALPSGFLSAQQLSYAVVEAGVCLLLTLPDGPASLRAAAVRLLGTATAVHSASLDRISPAMLARILRESRSVAEAREIAQAVSLYIRSVLPLPASSSGATLTTLFDSFKPSSPSTETLAPLTFLLHTCAAAAPLPKPVQAQVAQLSSEYESIVLPLLTSASDTEPYYAELGVLLRAYALFRPQDAPPLALLTSVARALRLSVPALSASLLSQEALSALQFVCALCTAVHLLAPRPAPYFLSSLIALLHRLLASSVPSSSRQPVQEAYDSLLSNATHAGLGLAISFVRQELASHDPQRVRAAVHCARRLLTAPQGWRSGYVAKHASSVVSRLVQALHHAVVRADANSSALSVAILAILTSAMAASKRIAFANALPLLLSAFAPFATTPSRIDDACFQALYGLLQTALRLRAKEVFRSISLFLRCLDVLLTAVTEEGCTLAPLCAENVARLLEQLSSDPVQFRRYGVYVISSYIFALQNRVVKGAMKTALQPGVFAVINVCTSFDYMQLARVLDSAGKSIWRNMYADFEREFRFKGKV